MRPGRLADGPGPVDDRAGQPLFRPGRRQPHVGLFLRPGDRRSGGRFPLDQPADAPRAAGRTWPGTSRNSNYDLKALMRTIVQSRTYQLSGETNATNRADEVNYSRCRPRALDAVVLLDAISRVTGVGREVRLARLRRRRPAAARHAGDRPGPRNRPLPVPRRLRASQPAGAARRGATSPTSRRHCTCWPDLPTPRRLPAKAAAWTAWSKAERPISEAIEELYLAALCRLPTERERTRAGRAHRKPAHAAGSPRGARLGLDQFARIRVQPLTEAVMDKSSRTASRAVGHHPARFPACRVALARSASACLSSSIPPVPLPEVRRRHAARPRRASCSGWRVVPARWTPGTPRETAPSSRLPPSAPGIQISELFPRIAQHMDKLSVIRSVHTEENNHPQGTYNTLTGHRPNAAMKFPSIGSIVCKEIRPAQRAAAVRPGAPAQGSRFLQLCGRLQRCLSSGPTSAR